MTIVLTGASGMVGSAVFAELTQAGRKVRLLTYKGTGSGGSVESRQMPPAGADLSEFREALRGAGSVVHCAALNNDEGASSDALFEANAVLAGKLAQAAADVVPGRFVHLSSIRAVAGAESSGTVSEATPPAPTCAYGASKLAGEKAVREAFRDQPGRFVILRPAPIYGVGMRGGLRTLLRLADSPWPLPFASLAAPRSLLSLERAVGAILLALSRERLTRATMSSAMRMRFRSPASWRRSAPACRGRRDCFPCRPSCSRRRRAWRAGRRRGCASRAGRSAILRRWPRSAGRPKPTAARRWPRWRARWRRRIEGRVHIRIAPHRLASQTTSPQGERNPGWKGAGIAAIIAAMVPRPFGERNCSNFPRPRRTGCA